MLFYFEVECGMSIADLGQNIFGLASHVVDYTGRVVDALSSNKLSLFIQL